MQTDRQTDKHNPTAYMPLLSIGKLKHKNLKQTDIKPNNARKQPKNWITWNKNPVYVSFTPACPEMDQTYTTGTEWQTEASSAKLKVYTNKQSDSQNLDAFLGRSEGDLGTFTECLSDACTDQRIVCNLHRNDMSCTVQRILGSVKLSETHTQTDDVTIWLH